MDQKIIDNDIKKSKDRINQIDNTLSIEKKKIKKLDEIQDTFYELNKNLNICIGLLAQSIKGKDTDIIFNDIENTNRKIYLKSKNSLDEETMKTMKKINNLYKEKNDEIKKSKEKKEKE